MVDQNTDTLLVLEFPPLLDALYLLFLFTRAPFSLNIALQLPM